METKRPENLQEARREARRRRLRRRRIALVVSAVVLVLLIGIGVLLAVMEVTAIYVEGDTRYSYEQIVDKSGLDVGQNLLSVNKQEAYDRLRDAFPYLETIEVGNASFSELRITVKEVKIMAAVQVGEEYVIVGENNRALERVTADKVPANLLKIKGATLRSETIGKDLLDDRSLGICRTLITASKQYGLSGITLVDITQKTRISFRLKDRLEVVLGNETNIVNQVASLVKSLPHLSDEKGEVLEGLYDMINFSDGNPGNDRGFFTPQEDLVKQEQAESGASKDESGTADDTDKKPEKPEEEPGEE